jgi:ABC-type sugar transport system permease subunit
MGGLRASLTVAALSVLIAVPLALGAALALAERGVPSDAVSATLVAPAAIPAVVLAACGVPLLQAVGLLDSVLGLATVHAAMALPLAYILVARGLRRELRDVECVARSLGASRWTALGSVVLPALAADLTIAAAFVAALSLDDWTPRLHQPPRRPPPHRRSGECHSRLIGAAAIPAIRTVRGAAVETACRPESSEDKFRYRGQTEPNEQLVAVDGYAACR